MSPEECGSGFFLFEKFNGGSADSQLGAASVGDQGVRRGVLCDFGQDVQCDADWQRNVNQVGAANGRLDGPRKCLVRHTGAFQLVRDLFAIPAGDDYVRRVFSKGLGERAADEPGAENDDALNEMGHRYATRRPTAGAMMRISLISCANCVGSSDCAPSERAWSGSL